MISLFFLCLISIAFCGEVNENGKEISINTTTLYPVKNNPLYLKEPKLKENVTKVEKESIKQTDVASSEHNKYIESLQEAYKNHTDKLIALSSNESKSDNQNDEIIPNREAKMKTILRDGTKWSIDAIYAPSKSIDESDREEKMKDFKPSPHLGSFYDEDSFVVPTPVTESFIPYKPSYGSFEKDFFKMTYRKPVEPTPIDSPYRFENVPQTPDWHIESGLEPNTVEPPVKIPAGGLYKLPDPFQGKPNSDGDNESPEFKDQRDNSVKKRGNPWKGFLHMVTALLPVGLLVSALTPNVITFDNTDNNNPYYPSRVSRHADYTSPRISERCKRRLLCEIHADQNYISNLSVSQRKPCYKLHCEDPNAMNALLRWLLDHHSHHSHHNHHTPSYQPSDHDRRGYITRN